MKTNTLLALGLFTIAGVVTVSCGGSSDSDNTGTAGTTSTSAGTSSTAGTSSSAAGTANNTGGTASNTGGTGNNPGGGNFNFGGANGFPNFGGAGPDVSCPDGTKNGGTCTPGGAQAACQLNDTTFCGCQAGNNPTWFCIDASALGAGGQGPGGFEATCPADAKNGDACTGLGLCTGGTCVCYQNSVICM